ncbi:MAG: SDR family NAD(P)-dependent oxidoreductase, partial [Alphaproteobacteria bacterium]|nr:SDR family NAD(P)-dependent oxidoreductase [Alphaproteobacteria bacterium]
RKFCDCPLCNAYLKSDYKFARFFCCARNENSFAKWSPGFGDTLNGTEFFDFTDSSKIPDSVMRANSRLGFLDLVLIFHGVSFDQIARESDFSNLLSCFNVNCLSTLVFLQSLQHTIAKQGTGTIAVATSVAEVRGRPTNFVYGSAKSAVSTYLEGLRSTLYHTGVKVYDLKLGSVDTPMTKGEKKHC